MIKKNYKFASNEKYVFYIYEYKGSNDTQNIAYIGIKVNMYY
jgi:hypothetical protein